MMNALSGRYKILLLDFFKRSSCDTVFVLSPLIITLVIQEGRPGDHAFEDN